MVRSSANPDHACMSRMRIAPSLAHEFQGFRVWGNLYFECGNSRPITPHPPPPPPRPTPTSPTPHTPPYHNRTPPPPPTTTRNHHPPPQIKQSRQNSSRFWPITQCPIARTWVSAPTEWSVVVMVEGQIAVLRDSFERMEWLYLLFSVWDKNKKKHLDWVLSRWSPIYPLNLELTRPNSLVDCKMATDLMKINVKDADSYWNQMVTYGCVPNW